MGSRDFRPPQRRELWRRMEITSTRFLLFCSAATVKVRMVALCRYQFTSATRQASPNISTHLLRKFHYLCFSTTIAFTTIVCVTSSLFYSKKLRHCHLKIAWNENRAAWPVWLQWRHVLLFALSLILVKCVKILLKVTGIVFSRARNGNCLLSLTRKEEYISAYLSRMLRRMVLT